MNWSAIAAARVNDLTRTRSEGRPINTHVVRSHAPQAPDYERMKKLVHGQEDAKKKEPVEKTKV